MDQNSFFVKKLAIAWCLIQGHCWENNKVLFMCHKTDKLVTSEEDGTYIYILEDKAAIIACRMYRQSKL